MEASSEIHRLKRLHEFSSASLVGLKTTIASQQQFATWGAGLAGAGIYFVLESLGQFGGMTDLPALRVRVLVAGMCSSFVASTLVAVYYYHLTNKIGALIQNSSSVSDEIFDLEIAFRDGSATTADTKDILSKLYTERDDYVSRRSTAVSRLMPALLLQYGFLCLGYIGIVILAWNVKI